MHVSKIQTGRERKKMAKKKPNTGNHLFHLVLKPKNEQRIFSLKSILSSRTHTKRHTQMDVTRSVPLKKRGGRKNLIYILSISLVHSTYTTHYIWFFVMCIKSSIWRLRFFFCHHLCAHYLLNFLFCLLKGNLYRYSLRRAKQYRIFNCIYVAITAISLMFSNIMNYDHSQFWLLFSSLVFLWKLCWCWCLVALCLHGCHTNTNIQRLLRSKTSTHTHTHPGGWGRTIEQLKVEHICK